MNRTLGISKIIHFFRAEEEKSINRNTSFSNFLYPTYFFSYFCYVFRSCIGGIFVVFKAHDVLCLSHFVLLALKRRPWKTVMPRSVVSPAYCHTKSAAIAVGNEIFPCYFHEHFIKVMFTKRQMKSVNEWYWLLYCNDMIYSQFFTSIDEIL